MRGEEGARGDWWFGLRGMAATERETKIRTAERRNIMINERVVIVWDAVVGASGWLYCLCSSVYGRPRGPDGSISGRTLVYVSVILVLSPGALPLLSLYLCAPVPAPSFSSYPPLLSSLLIS